MKAKKKPILITALSVLLSLSLVFGIMVESPIVAFAVTQSADNEYVFDFGDKVHIVGWYGAWDAYPKPWEDSTDEWWNDAVSTFNGRRWKTEPYMRWQNGDDLQHNFLAYYPEDLVNPNSNLTNVGIHLTGYLEDDDILVAIWEGARPDDDTLELEFDHLLSRFDLNIVFGSEYPNAEVVSVYVWLPQTGYCDLLNGKFSTEAIGNTETYEMTKTADSGSEYDWSGSCIAIPMTVPTTNFITIKCKDAGKEEYTYAHDANIVLKSGERTTLTLYIGEDVVELTPTSSSSNFFGGWDSETSLDGATGTIGIADEGKTSWEDGDTVFQHLNSSKYGNQTATLTFKAEDATWSAGGTLKYLEEEKPKITAVYAPGCEIKSDNTIGLRDGQQYGMAEYIKVGTNIANGTLNVDFSSGRDYSRLRIVATPNEKLTVTTTGFTPAGPEGTAAPESYTLTADENGNAYLYGTFTAGGTVTVKSGSDELVTHTFDEETNSGESYALEARVASVQIDNETKYYSTIAEAFTAVADKTAYIRLLNDTDFNSQISVTGNVTFDLNGHTASFEGDSTSFAFSIQTGANMTIQDSSAEKNGYITSGSATSVYANNAGLKLIAGRVDCIAVYAGTFEMTGGTVEKGINSNSATVTISGGTVHGATDGVKCSVSQSGQNASLKISNSAELDGDYMIAWTSGTLDLSAYSSCDGKQIYVSADVADVYSVISLPTDYVLYCNGAVLAEDEGASAADILTIGEVPVGAMPEG